MKFILIKHMQFLDRYMSIMISIFKSIFDGT